jgi:hypothetical protein
VRRDGAYGWRLEVAGEAPWPIDLTAEDPARRAGQLEADGVDGAVVCLSSALGVERLPGDEAAELIAAHEQGLDALPDGFRRWGSVSLADPDPGRVDALLGSGAVGLVLPAGALATPASVERVLPLLEPLERHGRPLFVHPGPSPWGAPASDWWTALTSYVAEMNAAWHALVAAPPNVAVVFALLAGLAPLQIERLGARGGPAEQARDERFFYDVSSYGPMAIEAVARVVGVRQLVYGSDRPMAEPGAATWHTRIAAENSARLLAA